jgi:RNA polymerase sigma-70 factor (ECF subfamily)
MGRGSAGDGASEAETALSQLPGMGPGRRGAGSGNAKAGSGIVKAGAGSKKGQNQHLEPDFRLQRGKKEDLEQNSVDEEDESAQPSQLNGVEEDMATLVLDNTSLGSEELAGGVAGLPLSVAARAAAARAAALAETGESPAELSDAAIMLRVAAGDDSCFNYLVGKHHRPIIHFLTRMVRNQAVAEEMAQEVFLRVYRSRESYRAEAKFTTWLYRIATNLAVNHARDTKHERMAQNVYLDQPDAETGTTPDVADAEPTVEARLVENERMAAIRAQVMALPERQRMAVLMHKYQGLDYREIGDVLKLSESATKSLLFRAYQTLRETLKAFV